MCRSSLQVTADVNKVVRRKFSFTFWMRHCSRLSGQIPRSEKELVPKEQKATHLVFSALQTCFFLSSSAFRLHRCHTFLMLRMKSIEWLASIQWAGCTAHILTCRSRNDRCIPLRRSCCCAFSFLWLVKTSADQTRVQGGNDSQRPVSTFKQGHWRAWISLTGLPTEMTCLEPNRKWEKIFTKPKKLMKH